MPGHADDLSTPGTLAAVLLEEALRHIRAGLAALEEGRTADGPVPLREAMQIIIALHAALDRDRTPELAAVLAGIYRFVCFHLNDAALLHDPRPAREAARVFEPIADAFGAAAARLARRGEG